MFMQRFARPLPPGGDWEDSTVWIYDNDLQLNVLADGRPVIQDRMMLAASGTTTSTAGSKTHFDD